MTFSVLSCYHLILNVNVEVEKIGKDESYYVNESKKDEIKQTNWHGARYEMCSSLKHDRNNPKK